MLTQLSLTDVLAEYTRPHDPARLVCVDEASKQLIAETPLGIFVECSLSNKCYEAAVGSSVSDITREKRRSVIVAVSADCMTWGAVFIDHPWKP
jgi:hypothetical protein